MNKPEPEVIDHEQAELDQQDVTDLVAKFQRERTYGWLQLKFDHGVLVEIVERHQRRP